YKPLRDASGSIYAIMNVAVDVTELVNAREKAKANENEYRTLAEAMPQMVWTAVPSGKIDYCNRNMCEMLDCTAEELAINDFTDIIHPSDLRLMKALWKEATEKKESFEHEYRMRDHRTGQYSWFLGTATPVKENDEIVKWIGSCTNINEFKNLVTQKDTFLGIASHELKTPLTSLKLYAQVLERMLGKSGDQKHADLAKKMDLQVVKLTSLIADLLDVTKINAGKIHLNEAHFDFKS